MVRSDAGFLLIEVIISALLVGLIVVATLTGFDVVNRASADQRQRSQAAVLAAQSQEQLRSDPASTLQTLQASPHSYTQTVGGTTYTIVQKTELQPVSGSNAACSVTETKRQSGNAYRITSTVTWPQQQKAKRPAVVASSLITPPTGSALEVDANNAPTVTAGVSGITAIVKFTPVGGGSLVTLEQTTGSGGCVVFGGIPSTAAVLEIGELAGYVTRNGGTKYPTKEVRIAPNYTTHDAILYNRGGAIRAEFAYNSKKAYTHSNNEGTGNVEETVASDTFVTFNALIEAAPDFEVGSTLYATPTTVYKPLAGTYEATGSSPSNLFPFAESEVPWSVYAGDCVENNPKEVTGGVVKPPEKIFVSPGSTTPAQVPTSLVTLNLYKGTEAEVNALGSNKWKNLETTTARSVTITNPKCAGTIPNNESAISVKHAQQTTTGAPNGGHLARPFQPFGSEFELCVYVSPRAYTHKYEDKETKGPVFPIYLGQHSTQEKTAQRVKEEKEESETQANREATEKASKTNREATEAAAKKAAEKTEATEKTKWEKERSEGKISKEQLKTKENTQTTARIAREKAEATNKKKAEEAETATRVQKEKEETEVETKRKANETTEATEATNSKVTVETRAECP